MKAIRFSPRWAPVAAALIILLTPLHDRWTRVFPQLRAEVLAGSASGASGYPARALLAAAK